MTTGSVGPRDTPVSRALAEAPGQAVEAAMDRIRNPRRRELNAWVRVYDDLATAGPPAPAGGPTGRLSGLPVGDKDVIAVAGRPLTASSARLAEDAATEHARVWERLAGAGAVAVGHCHTHEFAAGATTDQCGNPWDPARSPGGSSGGSAVAVASGAVPVALGTDTAGSLRIPAALCGISTIKPTEGAVSTAGTIPFGSSFDTVGPMALHVSDLRPMVEQMVEPETLLRMTAGAAHRRRSPEQSMRGLRIGVLTDRVASCSEEVATAFQDAVAVLVGEGAVLRPLGLPTELETALRGGDYMDLLLTDIWEFHRTLRRLPETYGDDVATLVATASDRALGPEARLRGHKRRRVCSRAWEQRLDELDLDAAIEPTCPIVAPPRVAPGAINPAGSTLASLTTMWSFTGSPVVAFPAAPGRTSGLSVGVSLVGRHHDDLLLLDLAARWQHHLPPPMWSPS